MVKVKGNVIYHVKKILIEICGEESIITISNKMSPEGKEWLNYPIISGEMYDLKLYWEMMDSIYNEYGAETYEKIFIELGNKQFGGIFGFISRLITPQKILSKSRFLWNKIYDGGKFEVKEFTKNKLVLSLTEFEFTKTHALSVEIYLRKWCEIVFKKKINSKLIFVDKTTTEFVFDIVQ